MNKGVMCFSYLLHDIPKPCDIHCKFYEKTLACPFRTPRECWDTNLCQCCTHKISECGFEGRVVRNKDSDNVVGCFGFVLKEGEGK